MTTAICIYCGSRKFVAFGTCAECKRTPTERADVVKSLALTDHYFDIDELSKIGADIKIGREPAIDESLQKVVDHEVNEEILSTLIELSNPVYIEKCRRHERNVLWGLIAFVLAGIAFMIFRFLFT